MLHPLPAAKWNDATAAHLLNRAGFGGTPAEIARLRDLGLDGAVASLVDYENIPDPTPAPDWAKPDPDRARKFKEARELRLQIRRAEGEERQKLEAQARDLLRDTQREQRTQLLDLRGWWLARMARGPRPLQEKLTLFWHGHFATSVQKVKDTYLMWLQNDTFRRLAAGNWLQLLIAVTRDPAMLVWLDQAQSRKQHPNENYAREVMELFALGEGHYTERDITEAARAFTGLTYDRLRQEGDYRPFIHDDGVKTVLGKTGKLTWTDVLQEIVAQPQAGRFICAKLWRFFAGDAISDDLTAALATVFRKGGQNFKPVLRAIFLSEEFYSPAVVRTQVKSPVQWLVGSVRLLERELPPTPVASRLLADLGQDLFAPPNVKGWDGGLAWITTNNLLTRYNQAENLVYGINQLRPGGGARDGKAIRLLENRFNRRNRQATPVEASRWLAAEQRANKEALLSALESRLLQSPLPAKRRQVVRDYLDAQGRLDDEDILETIRLIMSTPDYQLT